MNHTISWLNKNSCSHMKSYQITSHRSIKSSSTRVFNSRSESSKKYRLNHHEITMRTFCKRLFRHGNSHATAYAYTVYTTHIHMLNNWTIMSKHVFSKRAYLAYFIAYESICITQKIGKQSHIHRLTIK